MRTKRKPQSIFQYEPLITPSNWNGEERQFAVRLTQLLDQLFARKSSDVKTGDLSGVVKSVDSVSPDGNGNVQLGAVRAVNGKKPDASGDVTVDSGPQGEPGNNGVTFVPSLSADGDLSWSNDGGLANPATVNIRGPKGEQGLKGDTGETGPQGIQGEKGDKGDTGETGPMGPQGEQGIQGPKGDKGDTGGQGPQGIQGEAGPKGDPGETGATGAQGPQGPQGDTGPAGYTPQRGVDYWTEADKAEIVDETLAQVGPGGGGNGTVQAVDGVTPDENGNVQLGAAKVDNYITEMTEEQLEASTAAEKAELYAQGVRILSVRIGNAAETYYSIDADGNHVIVNGGGLNGRATPLVLSVNSWTGDGPYSLTLPTMGVTSDASACHVVVAPSPGSIAEYGNAGIYVSAQMEGALIFSAESLPENDLVVNILIVTPNGYTSVVPNPEYGYLRYDEPQALTDEQKGNVITALGLNTEQPETGVQVELLWENASPTSDFAAQSIAIETDSEYLLIEHTSNGGGDYGVALVRKNKTTRISCVVNDSWGLYSKSRGASFDGEKVTFGVGSSYMYTNSKHTLAEHNTNCVPNRILALKVVTK